jgi:hypothetical protein
VIFYIHIPKTGGQTLATRMASAFVPARTRIMGGDIASAEELAVAAERFDFLEAHTDHAALASLDRSHDLVVSVREPVGHLVSHYRHIRREVTHPLHRIAVAWQAEPFLERFATQFRNFQTHSLARAFATCPVDAEWSGTDRWALPHAMDGLDRCRWVVPTEEIGEFVRLWSLETGLFVPASEADVNRAGPDGVDVARVRRWAEGRSDLWAADRLLWDETRRRFEAYRDEVVRTLLGSARFAQNAACAFHEPPNGVWLGQGWHPRTLRSDGVAEWWSGPGNFSSVLFRRTAERTQLQFEVAAMNGVELPSLVAYHRPTRSVVSGAAVSTGANGLPLVSLSLAQLGLQGEVQLFLGERYDLLPAPSALEPVRRSYASQNWRLVGPG